MQEQQGSAEFKLDTLTRSVRFVSAIPGRTATRVGLGVALGLEDSATDPAGELLGIKIAQGMSGVACTVGAIRRAASSKAVAAMSSAKDVARSVSDHVGASGSALQRVPALNAAAGFVGQAAAEVRESWDASGYVAIEVVAEEPAHADEATPVLANAEPSL